VKLRNRKKFINTLPEGNPPDDLRPKLTRWAYFFVLFAVVTYLAYIIVMRVTFVHAYGQVEVEKIIVSAARGGRLTELLVKQGEQVKKGQRIARIAPQRICTKLDQSNRNLLEKLNYEIKLKQRRLADNQKNLEQVKNLKHKIQLRRILETDEEGSANRLLKQENNLKLEIDLHKSSIALAKKHYKQIQQKNISKRDLPAECLGETLIAPRKGRIVATKYQVYDVISKATPIAVIRPENPEIIINAYFPEDAMNYLSTGKVLNISFPDDWESKAIIKAISSQALNLAEPLKKDYTPVKTGILVRMQPVNKNNTSRWQNYDRMEVYVRARQ